MFLLTFFSFLSPDDAPLVMDLAKYAIDPLDVAVLLIIPLAQLVQEWDTSDKIDRDGYRNNLDT